MQQGRTGTGGRRQESEVDAHDHHDERQLRRHTGGLAEAVDDRHEHHAHGAVVHDLGQGHGGEADEQGKRDGRALAEERRQSVFGNFSFYSYKKACGQKKTVRGSKNSRRLSNGTPAI